MTPSRARSGAGRIVGPSLSVAGIGLVMAAIGVLPGLLGGSLHTTLEWLRVTHWILAALMPFSVGAGAALAVRSGRPEDTNGAIPALRTLAIAVLGSLLAEGFFREVGSYGGGLLTGHNSSAIVNGDPNPFTAAQFATLVGLGVVAGLLMARAQWRGQLRLRR